MAIAFGSIGTKVAAGTGALSLGYPASWAAGDLLIAARVPSASNSMAALDETGWVACGDLLGANHVGAAAGGSHQTRIRGDQRVADGSDPGTASFDQSFSGSGATVIGVMARYTKAAGATWDVAYATGDDASHGTDRSATSGSLDVAAGDLLVALVAVDDDASMTITSPTFAQSGVTFGTVNRRTSGGGTSAGFDSNVEVFDVPVSSGSGSGAVTFSFTTATNQCGPVAIVRLREVASGPADADLIGAATTVNPTATGSLTGFNASAITGAVTTALPAAAGVLLSASLLTGSPTTVNPEASGVLTAAESSITGAATTENPTAAGLLNSTAGATVTGAATTANPTAAGVLSGFNVSSITGAATTINPSAAGVLTAESVSDLTGAATTENPTAAGSLTVETDDEFTCLDLDTDVTPIFGTTVVDGELVPPTDDYTYTIVSGLGELDPDTTYQIRLAFDGGSFDTSDDPESYVSLYLSQGPDEADYLAGGVYTLLSGPGPHDNPAIFTIGPGVGSWAAGHAAEHRYLFIEGPTNSNVTAICHAVYVEPPEIDEPEPVETDPELVEVAPVDQGEHEDAWHTYPTIAPGPAWQAWDVAFVLDADGNKIEKRKDRLRDVVLVDGVDITTINGHRTHTADYQRMKPFSFGPGSIRPQGINAILDDLSSYSWLKPWAKVLVLRVNDDNEIVKVDHRGHVLSIDVSGADVTLSLGGMFSGRAAVQWRPKPLIRRRENPVYWLHAMFRKNRMPLDTVDLGFDEVTSPPQGWHLNCALDVVAGAVKRNGDALTVAYDETAKKFAAALVDRETIHATVYLDHGLMRAELTRDFSAEKNQVYAAGTDENGIKILFAVAPGMEQVVPAPDYPLASGDPFGEGTEDADTTDGAGISRLILRLIVLGYMQRDDKSGGFDADVARAVTDARIDAKLDDYGLGDPTLEQVDEDLWAWLWDVDATGLTMKEARIRPAYEVPGLGKYNFTATGQLKGINPDHDPDLMPVSEVVDFTTSMRKGQMKKRARRYVFDGPNWSGTITPTVTGVIAGEHNPGDPFTEADVISARDVREGWNLWVPNFEGGTLFHVSGIDVSDDGFGVRFMVDTQARDTLTINEILDRQEQNRLSPSKAFWKQASGNFGKDTITGSIGEIGGKVGTDVFCPAGQWTILPVPIGDYGLIQQIRTRLRLASETIEDVFEGSSPFASADGIEHMVMLFGRDVRTNKDTRESAFLDARRPDPFGTGDFADVKAAIGDFKDRGLLGSWGGENEDGSFSYCGYGDFGIGDGTGPQPSGNFFDDSGFPFRAPDCVAYIAIQPQQDAYALAGRHLWWQLDEGT